MKSNHRVSIDLQLDGSNPGHFFACCGLLELAHRLWNGVEGQFVDNASQFRIIPIEDGAQINEAALFEALRDCSIRNTLTAAQLQRREELSSLTSKQIKASEDLAAEKKHLDSLWREAPLVLGTPFELTLDWFADDYAGGSTFKTWAGQQSVIEIARGLQRSLKRNEWQEAPAKDWLYHGSSTGDMPFNFDSALGGAGAARDIGFSFDPLKSLHVFVRPMIELCAFIGLQRFRPMRVGRENRYQYVAWRQALVPEVAFAAACGAMSCPQSAEFEFRLLYRTKYLKSFLPAKPVST